MTLAALRAEFASRGLSPTKRLGQNFMIDPNLARAVAGVAGAVAGETVREVGAGAGHLTEALLATGATVVAVEFDRGLAAMLRERFAGQERFHLVETDVLAKHSEIAPEVSAAVREALAASERDSFSVAANLPYNIAARCLIALAWSELPWSGGAVTVQREVAERLVAAPGTHAYGASTVLFGLRAGGRIERVIGREVFWPRPEVDSALLVIEPDGRNDVRGSGPEFAAFVKALFSMRRKVLRKSLAHAAGVERERAEVALAAAGIDPASRVESVAPEAVLALFRAVTGAR